MKEVIEKLAEIDSKARRIMNNASEEKVRIEHEMKKEKEAYEKELALTNKKKLSDWKTKIENDMRPETEKVYQEGNEQLSEMENRFVSEKEKMAEEVFQRIIGA